jgi:hypothetical protein
MEISHALVVARADAANLARFIERRERFLDALDWPMMSEEHARQSSMLDDLLEGDMADAILYIDWLVDRLADDAGPLPGVLRFTPRPRPWQLTWITLAS